MNESFESNKVESAPSFEKLQGELEVALEEVRNAATVVGSTNNAEGFGFVEILEEKREEARKIFEALLKAAEEEGEKAGIAARQGDLPLE